MEKNIRFAHLADLHLGAWREKKLTKLNFITFQKAIDKIILEKLEFVIFAGDIFNVPIPTLDLVDLVAKELMRLKKEKIPLYIIGGSHDYSNSGKSFISLLETMELFIDLSKYELVDKNAVNLKFFKDNSGAKLSGILGRKNGLDKNLYKNLNKTTLSKENFNIFVFHTTLNDIKPNFMKQVNSEVKSNMLPKGFDYYAGGHIHTFIESKYDEKKLSYPGALFPNNFRELIREDPSFNICLFDFKTRKTTIKREFVKTYEKEYLKIEFEKLNPIEIKNKIEDEIKKLKVENKIILLEILGNVDGKIKDIKLNSIIHDIYNLGAQVVLKNTYKLKTVEVQENNIITNKNIVEIEKEIILKELLENENKKNEFELANTFLNLNLSKLEDEKTKEFEERIIKIFQKTET